jgi:hypothetical protein
MGIATENDLMPTLEKLHPQVWVFRRAIKNPETLMEKLMALPDWQQWWVFGSINDQLSAGDTSWDDFPTEDQWQEHIDYLKTRNYGNLTAEIEEYFYGATKTYIDHHGIELDNWVHQTPSVCLYKSDSKVSDKMTMHYHTDWQPEKAEARGTKFRLTCTMYLNEDYDGGELAFVIRNNRDDATDEIRFDYKPSAGDILVFPSTEPFYHGVKPLTNGDRFFIRNFWLEYFPGTPEWLEGEAQYGEEVWAEMEKEREHNFRVAQRTVE